MSWESTRRAAKAVERIAFVAAATAYLLPFFDPHVPFFSPVFGLQIFMLTIPTLAAGPLPWALVFFAAYGLPLIAAVLGFAYRRKENRRGALAGLIFAAVGFDGLAIGYWGSSTPSWGFHIGLGFWAAELAFLLAAVAAAFRLIAISKFGGTDKPIKDEPAMSASQWFLMRSRRD